MLVIECDCKNEFNHPCNYSLVECSSCGNKEYWHSDAVDYMTEYKVMKNKITIQWKNIIYMNMENVN